MHLKIINLLKQQTMKMTPMTKPTPLIPNPPRSQTEYLPPGKNPPPVKAKFHATRRRSQIKTRISSSSPQEITTSIDLRTPSNDEDPDDVEPSATSPPTKPPTYNSAPDPPPRQQATTNVTAPELTPENFLQVSESTSSTHPKPQSNTKATNEIANLLPNNSLYALVMYSSHDENSSTDAEDPPTHPDKEHSPSLEPDNQSTFSSPGESPRVSPKRIPSLEQQYGPSTRRSLV